MRKYLDTRNCRRKFILNYLEDSFQSSVPSTQCCDNCYINNSPDFIPESKLYKGIDDNGLFDFTHDAHLLLSAMALFGGCKGIGAAINLLCGKGGQSLLPHLKSKENVFPRLKSEF